MTANKRAGTVDDPAFLTDDDVEVLVQAAREAPLGQNIFNTHVYDRGRLYLPTRPDQDERRAGISKKGCATIGDPYNCTRNDKRRKVKK